MLLTWSENLDFFLKTGQILPEKVKMQILSFLGLTYSSKPSSANILKKAIYYLPNHLKTKIKYKCIDKFRNLNDEFSKRYGKNKIIPSNESYEYDGTTIIQNHQRHYCINNDRGNTKILRQKQGQFNKLIVFYDMNKISIDGDVNGWFTENVPSRFKSYGWNVIKNVNGHDFVSIRNAINKAKPKRNRIIPEISANRLVAKSMNKLAIFLISIYMNQLYHFV